MDAITSLFDWLPGPLEALFIGAVAIFILVGLFKLVCAVIRVITDLIPGW